MYALYLNRINNISDYTQNVETRENRLRQINLHQTTPLPRHHTTNTRLLLALTFSAKVMEGS